MRKKINIIKVNKPEVKNINYFLRSLELDKTLSLDQLKECYFN